MEILDEFCALPDVKTRNRSLEMDRLGDAEFSFFSSTLTRGKK